MPKSLKIFLLAVSSVLVFVVLLGPRFSGVSAATEPQQQQDGAYRQINVYSEVLRHVQTDYVVDPNIPDVTSGALRGLLESLDADSSYLSADDYKAYKADKGGKAQVGINISKRYGYAIVVSTVPGSPADRAGLNNSDIIEAIDGHDTRDISLAMIRMMLEGDSGSELMLAVIRPRRPAPDKIILNRTVAQIPAVTETMYENSSILYLKPLVLDREHVQQVESKLKAMNKAGNKKILLDLRDTAAGDMNEAIRLANLFLKSGTIAMLEGQKVPRQTFTAEPSKAINATAPMTVLVNRGTAGPGELVAAALQDNHRANLVGEKTFGEGSQQKTFELEDGAALILSVAKYESPSGKKLQDEGVTPEVIVASSSSSDDDGVDEDMDDSISPDSQPAAPAPKPAVTVDDQLNKALGLLKSKTS
ncbi:MAG: S41 family peptidase [Acidobacteriaceae bacterium]|nr:S41 family peptidase [Acidobacteriaceae bacterium]